MLKLEIVPEPKERWRMQSLLAPSYLVYGEALTYGIYAGCSLHYYTFTLLRLYASTGRYRGTVLDLVLVCNILKRDETMR